MPANVCFMSVISSVDSLYRANHGWLVGFLFSRLKNELDAADLAHDAFIRLLRKPLYFDSPEKARSYLSKLARGLVIDLWRRREIELAWQETVAQQVPATACSEEQRLVVLETLIQVDAMLASLEEKVRTAFLLSQLQSLSYREIAATMGVTERSVKNYMAKAMLHCIQLQNELDDCRF